MQNDEYRFMMPKSFLIFPWSIELPRPWRRNLVAEAWLRRRNKVKESNPILDELFSIIFPHRIVQFELACKKKKKTFFSKSGRVKSRGETRGEVEIHRNLQTIPQRNEEERNTESNSAGKRLTRRGGGKNDCSPPPLFQNLLLAPIL